MQLIKDSKKFSAANLSRVFVDGFFSENVKKKEGQNAKVNFYAINVPDKEPPFLLELGNYNPIGKSFKSVAIKKLVNQDSLLILKYNDPEMVKKIAELHQSEVFIDMCFLRGYRVTYIVSTK